MKPLIFPKPMFADQDKAVLAWINSHREERGLTSLVTIPKGKRHSFKECPVALGLSYEGKTYRVASWGYTDAEGSLKETKWNPIPDHVADFIRRFDTGQLFQEYHDETL